MPREQMQFSLSESIVVEDPYAPKDWLEHIIEVTATQPALPKCYGSIP